MNEMVRGRNKVKGRHGEQFTQCLWPSRRGTSCDRTCSQNCDFVCMEAGRRVESAWCNIMALLVNVHDDKDKMW